MGLVHFFSQIVVECGVAQGIRASRRSHGRRVYCTSVVGAYTRVFVGSEAYIVIYKPSLVKKEKEHQEGESQKASSQSASSSRTPPLISYSYAKHNSYKHTHKILYYAGPETHCVAASPPTPALRRKFPSSVSHRISCAPAKVTSLPRLFTQLPK